jgi:CDP-diacylglycerol---glycerol-3-phosphate 3-phosphatidyltransferase
MLWTLPNILTAARIACIPVLVLAFYLPVGFSNLICVTVFVLAALTDWLDGWLARRWQQMSPFGAFLDPVADKLMVAVALILLLERDPTFTLSLATIIIIGREITISALREWMAEIGQRKAIRVAAIGKIKTIAQMVAIGFMLFREPLWGLPIYLIGKVLLYVAAVLTLWSMFKYLSAAWPVIKSGAAERAS